MKILEALDFVKSKSTLTSDTLEDTINILTRFISDPRIDVSPIDAYVLMDFIEKAFGAARKKVTPEVIKHIIDKGDMTGYGVDLSVVSKDKNDYSVDKSWNKYNEQISILKDLQKKREKELAAEVKEAKKSHKKPPIPSSQSVYIRPKYQ